MKTSNFSCKGLARETILHRVRIIVVFNSDELVYVVGAYPPIAGENTVLQSTVGLGARFTSQMLCGAISFNFDLTRPTEIYEHAGTLITYLAAATCRAPFRSSWLVSRVSCS